MDRKKNNANKLADFMKSHISDIDKIVSFHDKPTISYKSDNSAVTSLDLALSEFIEEKFTNETSLCFYSEEKFSVWHFPMLSVDPIDGTQEFIQKIPEWSVSIGKIENENWEGEGWIYNPKTKECFAEAKIIPSPVKDKYVGEVSRTEWNRGYYKDVASKWELKPVGSIAYKLGRLSFGYADFVVSLKPKNIWDIAAGTLLCKKAGFKFYSQGKEVMKVLPIYHPPLIWCHPSLFPELSKAFP